MRLFPPRPWRLLSPWPFLCSSSMPGPLPSPLPQLSSASSAASVLLKLHLLLQQSLLSLCLLLCLFLCFGRECPPEEGTPRERSSEARPPGLLPRRALTQCPHSSIVTKRARRAAQLASLPPSASGPSEVPSFHARSACDRCKQIA